MSNLTVGRIEAHAVAEDASAGRALADRLAELVARATQTLDASLAGLDDRELVCVRRVRVGLALDDASTDEGRARAWGHAIGTTIAGLVDGGTRPGSGAPGSDQRPTEVVRYRDLTAALADLVATLAVGSPDRAWAWALAGLTGLPAGVPQAPPAGPAPLVSADEDRSTAIRALAQRPAEAAAAVVAAAGTVGLAAVHRLLGPDGWRELAMLLLAEAGSSTATVALVRDAPASGGVDRTSRPGEPVRTRFGELAARCGLRVPTSTAVAWAAVALADARPDLLTAPDAPELLTDLAVELARTAGPAADHHADPGALKGDPPEDQDARSVAEAPREPDGETMAFAEPEPGVGLPTSRAGLLFLLAVAAESGLPDRALGDPRLAAREPGWTLGQLGVRLAECDLDDPAVRVFAGLRTNGDLGPLEPGDPEETAALDEAAALWVAATARRLREHATPQRAEDRALVRRVVARDGVILAGRGWVEVVLAAADVDVDVRRAGLDLDPGFVPWLGTVVRFRYE